MWELEVIVQNEILRASPQVQTGLTPPPVDPQVPLLARGPVDQGAGSPYCQRLLPSSCSCSEIMFQKQSPDSTANDTRACPSLKGSRLASSVFQSQVPPPHFPCSSNLLSHPAGDLGPDGGGLRGGGGGWRVLRDPPLSTVILQGEMLSRSEPLALAAQLRASGQLLVSSSIEASCLQQGCDGALGAQEILLPSPRHEVRTDLQYPLTILPDTTFRNGSQDLGSPSTGAPRRTTSSMIPWQSGERVQQSLSVVYATVGPDGRG